MNTEYRELAEWLLSYFEDEIKNGVTFLAENTISIGWTTIILKDDTRGGLTVYEPEFGLIPIKWALGANNTLRDLVIQKEVCAQVGADPVYPSMRQSGIISPRFLESHQEFEMARDSFTGNDSGWVFRETGYDGSSGTHCSLYEIAISAPTIIPFLALPPGSIMYWTGSNFQIETPTQTVTTGNNDFLKRISGLSAS